MRSLTILIGKISKVVNLRVYIKCGQTVSNNGPNTGLKEWNDADPGLSNYHAHKQLVNSKNMCSLHMYIILLILIFV